MFVFYIPFCHLLHFPSFSPKVPDFTSFFARHVSRLSSPGSEGILTNGRTDTGQRQYRPSKHKLVPWGWDKMPDNARPCHNRLYSNTPHHTISLKIWDARARLVEIFFMLKTCHVSGRCATVCHPPTTFRAPWVFPEFPKAQKTSAYLPVLTNSAYFALQTKTVSWEQKKKKTLRFFQFYELALPSVDLLSHQTQQWNA